MLSLPWLELSRFRRTTLTRLAMVVIVVIPSIYAGLYLASNWDPTGNLDGISAAVVNLDRGAEKPAGPGADEPREELHAGDELVDQVTEKGAAGFAWETAEADEAAEGLADGSFAAVLTIPANFSERLVSAGGDEPERAELRVATNDANNYVLGQVANTILTEIRAGLNETTTAQYADQIFVGFNDLHEQISEAADGASELHDGAGELHDGTGTLVDGSGRLSEGLDELHTAAGTAAAGGRTLASGASDLADGAESAESGSATLADGAKQVADGTGALSDKAHQIRARADDFDSRVGDLVDSAGPALDDAADRFESGRAQVSDDLQSRVDDLAADYPDDPRVADLQSALDGLESDLDSAHDAAKDARSTAQGYERDARNLADEVLDAVHEADDQISTLDDGAAQVSDGARDLHSGLRTLNDGAQQLSTGADDLADGLGQLEEGAGSAAEAGRQLAEGAVDLDDGAAQLEDGAGELASGLADGVEEIPTFDAADRENRSDVVALPVDAHKDTLNPVHVYGQGLAAFFIGLALWIGGMITYMVLKAIPYRALASSASSLRIAWSGYVPGLLFGIAQVVLLWAVLAFVLDFTVSTWLWTFVFSIVVAASFHAVHQMCVVLFGSIGRLVALVLLMLQIGAAGGTYPVETAPAFFQWLSPLLPMTYAVKGLRGMIAGGDAAAVMQASASLALFAVLALAVSTFACSRKRVLSMKDLHPSLTL
ncbi:YhgE/Pip domain-containing protein [Brevibacterium album]|uniref:YhgE/Pip domain-containing protein n=1 Tax=Brevibacterium album TaxID=417948 RepID=UPI0003FEAAC2|nr:YhgE/Pip domain-containing protein [Brevibacterium album]